MKFERLLEARISAVQFVDVGVNKIEWLEKCPVLDIKSESGRIPDSF
jgi:hypothetical protein